MSKHNQKQNFPVFILTTIALTAVFVVLIFVFSGSGNNNPGGGQNIKMENGKQIVEILAKGGYSPRRTIAKAGMPTVLRIRTQRTFDCSSALNVPLVGFSRYLDSTGVVDIDIPPQKVRDTVTGVCGMGMYSFKVEFE